MNPQIRHVQRACEAAKARQAVVVWFDEHGQFAVASYGEIVAECSAVKPVCNAVADAFDADDLPCPNGVLANNLSDKRRGTVGGWREYDELRRANDELAARTQAAEKFPRDHHHARLGGAACMRIEPPRANGERRLKLHSVFEPDPENHTAQWAFEVVRKIREIGNRQRTAWYVYDPEDGLDRYQTADEAKARAEQIMEEESDRAASNGWREDIGSLEWGELITHGSACCIKSPRG